MCSTVASSPHLYGSHQGILSSTVSADTSWQAIRQSDTVHEVASNESWAVVGVAAHDATRVAVNTPVYNHKQIYAMTSGTRKMHRKAVMSILCEVCYKTQCTLHTIVFPADAVLCFKHNSYVMNYAGVNDCSCNSNMSRQQSLSVHRHQLVK